MFVDSLIEICGWSNVQGWQGVKCHHCGATHNVLVNIPCIKCARCGLWLTLSWSHHQMCHRKPDYGFNRSIIRWAMERYSPHRHYFKDITAMLLKLDSSRGAKNLTY